MQAIRTKVIDAYDNAKHAHVEIFKEKADKAVAIGLLSICTAYSSAAHALYMANHETLERDELNDLFFEFQVFVKEAMDSYRTNHSHQWTDIQFRRLKEKYDDAASLLGLVLD